MTPEQRTSFATDFYRFYVEHLDVFDSLNSATMLGGFMLAIAELVKQDKGGYLRHEYENQRAPNSSVVALLDSVIEMMRIAEFEYYASYK